MNAEVLNFFSKWIEKETGIIYEEHNLYQLQDRLDQLSKHFGLSSSQELWQRAQSGISGEFRQLLIDTSTNNETSFFRDTKFFDCLKNRILPDLVREKSGLSNLQIWSVACSTGQEPYSLGMLLTEMGENLKQGPPKILATDISERVLARAKTGKYTDIEVGRGLSPAQKFRYFKPDVTQNWTLDFQVRGLVEFQILNLRSSFSLGRQFDLILCRNVLIYQRVDAKTEIIKKITQHLKPGGIFLMGAGESLIGLSSEYQQSLIDGVAVYRKIGTENKVA